MATLFRQLDDHVMFSTGDVILPTSCFNLCRMEKEMSRCCVRVALTSAAHSVSSFTFPTSDLHPKPCPPDGAPLMPSKKFKKSGAADSSASYFFSFSRLCPTSLLFFVTTSTPNSLRAPLVVNPRPPKLRKTSKSVC